MKVLAIISSPLQLLNFKEYILKYNIKDYKLIVLSFVKKEQKQLLEAIKLLKIDKFILLTKFRFLQYYYLSLFSNLTYNRIIIGNIFSDPHLYLFNRSKIKELTVLDDGINTSLISEYFKTNERLLKKTFFKQIIFKLLRINVSYPKKFELFTFIEKDLKIPNIKVTENNFSYLDSKIKGFNQDKNNYFIGQPFVELNITSKQNYYKYISRISKQYDNLIYIPSRKESNAKINEINKKLDIEILYSDINIELFFIKNKLIPKRVLGFTSSALITLNKMFNSKYKLIEVVSFKIKFDGKRFTDNLISKYYEKLTKSGVYIQKI